MSDRIRLPMLATLLLAAAPAFAEEKKDEKLIPGDLTATVTLATDYIFRGISQTKNGPAIQGNFDYAYMFKPEVGVYAGVFGSNLNFDEPSGPGIKRASIELDFYGGLRGEIRGIQWQTGFIQYYYPNAHPAPGIDYDYIEGLVKLGHDFGVVAVTGGVNFTGDYFGETGTGVYYNGDITVPLPFLPFGMNAIGHLGHQEIQNNARFGTPDYTDWLIGINGKVEGFVLQLAYTDTDISKGRCFPGTSLDGTCGARVVFSVSRTF